jgi:hypothetical protein
MLHRHLQPHRILQHVVSCFSLFSSGSSKDILFKLLTFGIPDNVLPITADGEPKVKSHRSWLKSRRRQEETQADAEVEIIVVPRRLDILLGRGKPIQEHFGNLRYHALLDYYQNAYERAMKFDKCQISRRIVETVHANNGRFLKQEGAGWSLVDDHVARDKVSHAFRTRRTSMISNSSAQAPTSSVQAPTETSSVQAPTVTTRQPVISKRKNGEDEAVPTIITSDQTTTVTDTEQEGSESSDVESEDYNAIGAKRVKVWAASFHEVDNT